MKPFAFKTQLRIGRAGEAFILGAHPELRWPARTERRWDLEGAKPDGSRRSVEVKCDTYPMLDTPNFFMESHTTIKAKSKRPDGGRIIGGPWRARDHGVDEFCYLFANGGTRAEPASPVAYWFRDVAALCDRLDRGVLDGEWEVRRNRSLDLCYFGYLVPRAKLIMLCDEVRYADGVINE